GNDNAGYMAQWFGMDNSAVLEQDGAFNYAETWQEDQGNSTLRIEQTGDWNEAIADQTIGAGNTALVRQLGDGNGAEALQWDTGNTVNTTHQAGDDNLALVT